MALDKITAIYDLKTEEFDKSVKDVEKGYAKTEKANKDATQSAQKNFNNLGNTAKKVGGLLVAAFGVQQLVQVGKEAIKVTGQFQKMAAVLENTLGSKSKAQKALKDIRDFASQTPFQVSELTNAFVKLANQGFRPTVNELRKLGDIAASQGKAFDQLAEAIIDAQVGEFERLKEFGIRASKQGENVMFTFKGVEKQVRFTETAIRDYILRLGGAEGVSGSMAAISETLEGQISNLKDTWEGFLYAAGTLTLPAIEKAIEQLKRLAEGAQETVEALDSKALTRWEKFKVLLAKIVPSPTNKEYAEFVLKNKELLELGLLAPPIIKEETDAIEKQTKARKVDEKAMEKALQAKLKLIRLQNDYTEATDEEIDADIAWLENYIEINDKRSTIDEESLAKSQERSDRENAIINEQINKEIEARRKASEEKKKIKEQEIQDFIVLTNALNSVITGGIALLAETDRDNAEFQKKLAITEIALSQAISIAQGIKVATQSSATPIDLFINIATITGGLLTAFAQIKNVAESTEIPSFDKGVSEFEGGLAKVHKDEYMILPKGTSVANKKASNQYGDIIQSMNDGTFDSLLYERFIQPSNRSLAENIANSFELNGVLADDRLLRNNRTTNKLLMTISKDIRKNDRIR